MPYHSLAQMKSDLKYSGVTLLELLVALAIFAVIGVIAYSGLSITLTLRSQTEAHATQLAQLQMAFSRLGRDIEQYVNRPIRNEYGDMKPAIQGTEFYVELTCNGWRNPAQQQRATLQRVAYFVEEGILWRSYWRVLDRAQNTEALKVELLQNVESITLRYLSQDLQWYNEWPPQSLELVGIKLVAVEITLVVKQWGSLPRIFQVIDS